MPAFYRTTVAQFIETPSDIVVGALSTALVKGFSGDHQRQLFAWRAQIDILQAALSRALDQDAGVGRWGVLFEFPLLRLQRRLDVVLLAGHRVLVIEFKIGSGSYLGADIQQVEDYALDLRDFHQASRDLSIVPILCATRAASVSFAVGDEQGVTETALCNEYTILEVLASIAEKPLGPQIHIEAWEQSPYRPVPSIIEAAALLYSGHEVREIAHASADPENLGATTDRLIEIVAEAKQSSRHIVAFVTGVPGSGKTLAGLNAVHDARFRSEGHGVGAFLSGNTPLVTVLREALARDDNRRTCKTLAQARREVRAEIQGLMSYLQEYLDEHPDEPPVDHVIVFDEAQRAWDATYGAQKFNRKKSEPALFLEIMDRHKDWAVIIALVGGGQEINRGERGLSEWGAALIERNKELGDQRWIAIAAPDVLRGGDATAWQALFADQRSPEWVVRDSLLHLGVSVRSYRCLVVTQWVNALLAGEIGQARRLAAEAGELPVFVTRDLNQARTWLKSNARGTRRCGLVASSGARRLRAEGLGVTLSAAELADVANWYLLPKGDIRSSFALEVAANEYTCQGLELDYVGTAWDGDLVWNKDVWIPRKLNGPDWHRVRDEDTQRWIRNKYRVLLTRARLGTVIWVPQGSVDDHTRSPRVLDDIARVLREAGANDLPST